MLRSLRALSAAVAAALCATTVLIGVTAGPAQAETYGNLPRTWTFTDRATPSTPNPDPAGNYLIGSRGDSTGRAYFTFDLTPLKGRVLHRVTFYTTEKTVDDCGWVAPIEVWRTTPVTAGTTWDDAPDELELLTERTWGKGTICPGAYLGIDMIPTVQAALDRGEDTVTLEVRVKPGSEEGLGRSMVPAQMSYAVNHAPIVSGLKLRTPDAGCGTLDDPTPALEALQFQATVTDADPNDYARIWFAYWPADRPDLRKETNSLSPDLTGIADGTVMAWTAQGRDYDDAGPWGDTCYFVLDSVAPATRPVVSSEKYPTSTYPGTGGPGVPGVFVLDAVGDVDTVAFDWYTESAITRTRPEHPGGRAEITVTPRLWGTNRVRVAAVDTAGNRGPWVEYRYEVRNTAPSSTFELNGVGLTSHITLYSQAAEVTGFGYAVDGGPETRVPAVDKQGRGDLVFTSVGTKNVLERAFAGDEVIGTHTSQVSVTDAPVVTSAEFTWSGTPIAGQPGSFTFAPRTTGVASYRYDLGEGGSGTVDAGPDGAATVSWTPQAGGYFTITVTSVDADGNRSQPAQSSFRVIDPHPTVSAYDHDSQVGRPITVNAWSDLPNATGIVYRFDDGPTQTYDSSHADFEVVPTRPGDLTLVVWARLSDGSLSPSTTIVLHVDSAPTVTAKGPFTEDAVALRPVTFTVTAVQPGAATFRYTVGSRYDGEEHPEQTVPVGADGTATITYDVPAGWGDVTLTVASLTAGGEVSDTDEFSVVVRNADAVLSTNPWPDAGGVGVTGQFGFSVYDLGEYTTSFVWHVNDGPVQETAFDPWAWETLASYTPDHAGANTLYLQRRFTDGSLSPVTEVPFEVGTEVAAV
ncbi:hypothetical protein [Actinoplanes sp. NBRC 101535]|uniref:hypothetical protein n=1 Tax=Actinoplanes sp. NBRC 101535 TaxID=3032196 RepID=UPI0024A04958|nr:hypothetical protein [Actinoplanes sp. NBRC 101535]GLY07917.1 hypothetical protein Acsp01_82960 [Actinoplanes sp. NBRC 101535]